MVTDPVADPVLTVRMEPPDTQARRLDLDVPRAVRVSPTDVAPWATVNWPRTGTFVDHAEVADWPVVSSVSVGAAQRLAGAASTGPGSVPADHHLHYAAARPDEQWARAVCGRTVSTVMSVENEHRTSCPDCLVRLGGRS